MQYLQLKSKNLIFSIIAVESTEGWRASVIIPSIHHAGLPCWQCKITSPIPGVQATEADAFQVAHHFAVVNASGDRQALSELHWFHQEAVAGF